MRRSIAASLVLAVLASCSKGDPETSRLRTGSEALAVDRENSPPGEFGRVIPLFVERPPDAEFELAPSIGVGTRILVVKDDDKGEDNPMRQVVVKVQDGEHSGKSGKMMRWSLRPVR